VIQGTKKDNASKISGGIAVHIVMYSSAPQFDCCLKSKS
jgi:hypothetical protein